MNTADSEEMAQPLQDRGFIATADPAKADIIMMNTCTVRDQAEHRADSNLGRLREWKAENPDRILIVAGCAATRWGESIQKKYPFIDAVSPATKIEEFPEFIAGVLKNRWDGVREARISVDPGLQHAGMTAGLDPEFVRPLIDGGNWFGDENTAYVTIMRGCNYTCSYCIVPQVRGREVYRAMPQILEEIRDKASQGFREVMLLGQTVNSYHYRENDTPRDFTDLLRAVNTIEGIESIRFMSPHPRHMRDSVIEAMKDCSKVARHLHLPLQSGSTRILGEMKRLYTREEYTEIIEKLRAAIPTILITTDVIVGYPEETDADFAMTLSLMRALRFNGLFAFKYSPRPGTASAEMADDIPDAVKEERLQTILALNTEIKNDTMAAS